MDVVCLRELEGLGGLEVRCGAEVEVVAVEEDFEGFGCGVCCAGAEEDGVKADLAGKAANRNEISNLAF